MIAKFLTLVFFSFFLSIGLQAQNLKKYYFPPNKFKKGLIYHYHCKEDQKQDMYWSYTFNDKTKIFNTLVYLANYELGEDFRETFRKDGAYAEKFLMYEDQQAKAVIIKDSLVYSWKDTTEFSLKMYIPKEGVATSFSKSRKYLGKENLKIGGKNYSCIKFEEHYKFVMNDMEEPYEFTEISYYAKGFGLVKFIRVFKDKTLTHELKEILSKAEWDALNHN
jgi:hypothetical protein